MSEKRERDAAKESENGTRGVVRDGDVATLAISVVERVCELLCVRHLLDL